MNLIINAIGDYEFNGKHYTKAQDIINDIAGFDVEEAMKRRDEIASHHTSSELCYINDYGVEVDRVVLPADLMLGRLIDNKEYAALAWKLHRIPETPEHVAARYLKVAEGTKGKNAMVTEMIMKKIASL